MPLSENEPVSPDQSANTQDTRSITRDPEYRQSKEDWTSDGCLPENDLFDKIERLAKLYKEGKINEQERQKTLADINYLYRTGEVTIFIRRLFIKALGY